MDKKDKINSIEELTLEESFEKINEIMAEMSDSDLPLEESFEKYKLGMQLLKHAGDQIDRVEKQIQVLNSAEV